MENHAKYGESIYFHGERSLYVNLFIGSELNWKDEGVRVRQMTRFPEEDDTRLEIECAKPVQFALKVRYPSWAHSGIALTVNNVVQTITESPGSYVTVDRKWNNGDKVEIRLPMSLHLESMPDDSSVIALLYGPIVLAADLGDDGVDSALQYGPSEPHLGRLKPVTIPAFVCDRNELLAGVKPVAGTSLEFRTSGISQPDNVILRPFYKIFKDRYTVYWRTYSAQQWQQKLGEDSLAAAKRKDIEQRTVDDVIVGDRQNERNHNLLGDTTMGGVYDGRGWRESRNGWFSYNLKIGIDKPVTLVCTYQGSEGRRRIFKVIVDDVTIATQTMIYHPTESFDVEYRLPEKLTKGKRYVTVKFQAESNAIAGSVLDVRVVQ